MDTTPRRAQHDSNTYSYNRNYNQQGNQLNQQQELVDLIQHTIRLELDDQITIIIIGLITVLTTIIIISNRVPTKINNQKTKWFGYL